MAVIFAVSDKRLKLLWGVNNVNTIWSENIQGILNLDLSREMRFRDDRKELFLNLLGLKEGMTIVDIGCGPGTITRKLSKWLDQKSQIIGIDRDSNFINYAKEKAAIQGLNNICYYEGDALKLPLENNSVDSCISHTVIEHVPNREFLLEQKRICRTNGRVSVMYARPDKYIKTETDISLKQCERENELLDKLFKGTEDIDKKNNVGKYWPDPVGLPKLFEETGFKNVQVDAIAVPIAIDDSRNCYGEKLAMVEAEKQQMFEVIEMGLRINNNGLTDKELIELRQLIDIRFDKRISFIKEGISIWDYSILLMQIVSGMVE
jgi:ubiquinone/menaquinone biosynthesis C-methylase UbiE